MTLKITPNASYKLLMSEHNHNPLIHNNTMHPELNLLRY